VALGISPPVKETKQRKKTATGQKNTQNLSATAGFLRHYC
jgi:hypothetical protein